MDAKNIHLITAEQYKDIYKAAIAHRPHRLLYFSRSSFSFTVEAVCEDWQRKLGEWKLLSLDGSSTLSAVIDGILYMEKLDWPLSQHWDRLINGLQSWVKAANGVELSTLSSDPSKFDYLTPNNVMDPIDFRLLGGDS